MPPSITNASSGYACNRESVEINEKAEITDSLRAGSSFISHLKNAAKLSLLLLGLLIMALPGAMCWLERRLSSSDRVFLSWGQFCAILPGLPGAYLRKCFYCLTLQHCASDCSIGFLSLITSRETAIEQGVYIGPMSVIGVATLGRGTLIGTRVGIMNGGEQHPRRPNGALAPFDRTSVVRTHIGVDSWIGEAAIIMADVGARCTVGAGSVVHRPISDDCVVAGNPARFIRHTFETAANR